MNRPYRTLAVVLTVALLFVAVPFQAAAEDGPTYTVRAYIPDQNKGIAREVPPLGISMAVHNAYTGRPMPTPSKEKYTVMLLLNKEEESNKLLDSYHWYCEIRPREIKVDGNANTITKKQYDDIMKEIAKAERAPVESYHPLWTTWTHHLDVATLEIKDKGKTYPKRACSEKTPDGLVTIVKTDVSSIVYTLLRLEIKSDSSKKYSIASSGSKLGAFKNATEAVMTLKSGRKLNVIINGKKLYVEMSDRDYAFEYTLAGDKDPFEPARKYLKKL